MGLLSLFRKADSVGFSEPLSHVHVIEAPRCECGQPADVRLTWLIPEMRREGRRLRMEYGRDFCAEHAEPLKGLARCVSWLKVPA